MFPNRPRRPMPQYHPARVRQPFPRRQVAPKPNLLSSFRDPSGKLDFNKITETAQQMKSIYSQVGPIITTFMKK
ncbi:YppG family protein [Virgibacillus necropolis]|nr:YppG family protein [Virgibacillus necropolis]